MNQVQLIIAAVVLAGLVCGSGYVGYRLADAKHLRAAEARQGKLEARRVGAAQRIAHIGTQRTVLREKVIREIREVPLYDTCRLPVSGLLLANEALTGKPASAGGLPRTDGAD